jgi:phenylpyruvate tautomerase PptA (4-oxalocrotonate tautomerase family)
VNVAVIEMVVEAFLKNFGSNVEVIEVLVDDIAICLP